MAKAKEITVVNTGLAAIYIMRERVLPDEEMTIPAEILEAGSLDFLISRGELAIKDDAAQTARIAEKVNKRKKKDPTEGKTQKELEDGGEF